MKSMKRWFAALLALLLLVPLGGAGEDGWVTRERASLVAPGSFGACADHPGAMIRLVFNDAWKYEDEGGHLFFTECKGYCAQCGAVVWQDAGTAHYESHALENGRCECGFLQPQWVPGVPTDEGWYDDSTMDPADSPVRYFSLSGHFDFGQTLNKPVYSGPGTQYLRGANGKSQFVSQEFRYGGLDGDWLLVCCSVKTGTRFGYINVREYRGRMWGIPNVDFAYTGATITRSTGLWDSMMQSTMGPLGSLRQGTRVTYLSTFVGEMTLAYVEAEVNGRKARGFVDLSCIQLDSGW